MFAKMICAVSAILFLIGIIGIVGGIYGVIWFDGDANELAWKVIKSGVVTVILFGFIGIVASESATTKTKTTTKTD